MGAAHAAGIGSLLEITLVLYLFLVADLRRSGTRIGRRSFYLEVALFDADGDLGLLRGGRISAD